jgi:hypothetical protein
LWQLLQLIVPLPESLGSKNSNFPKSILAGVSGLSLSSGGVAGSGSSLRPILRTNGSCHSKLIVNQTKATRHIVLMSVLALFAFGEKWTAGMVSVQMKFESG